MKEPLPIVFIPGLLCTPRLYEEQITALWRFGPVTVADHTRDDDIRALARRILATAPPRFALIGLSMGGYISMEILRQEPERVHKLALMDTSALPETPEQSAARRELIAQARAGTFGEITDELFGNLVAPRHRADERLRRIVRAMAAEIGPEAFERQENAIMSRPDSRPSLGAVRCPTLVLVGEQDSLTPPQRAAEIASLVPDSYLVTIPECGHLTTLERPAEVSRALTELLQR